MLLIWGVRGGIRWRGMRKVDMLNRSMNTLYLSTAVSDHNGTVLVLTAHLSDRVDLRYW